MSPADYTPPSRGHVEPGDPETLVDVMAKAATLEAEGERIKERSAELNRAETNIRNQTATIARSVVAVLAQRDAQFIVEFARAWNASDEVKRKVPRRNFVRLTEEVECRD